MKYIYLNSLLLLFLFVSCKKTDNKEVSINNQKLIDNIENNGKSLSKNQKTLDSLFRNIKEKNPNTQQLIEIAAKAYNLELYDDYFKYAKETNIIALKNNDSLQVAKSFWYIGDYFDSKMQLDSAYIYLDKADQIYQALHADEDIARMQQFKSIALFREGLYIEAENKALDALETLEKKPKTRLLYEIYLNLGNILDLNQQPSEALIYYAEAIHILDELYKKEIISEEDLQLSKAFCYNNIGNLYLNQKLYLNAETYLDYAYNILSVLNKKHELYSIVLTNLGALNININKLNKAHELLNESLRISKEMSYRQSLTANNFRLAELALKEHDTLQAVQYYKDAYTLSNETHANNTILKSLKALSSTDKTEGVQYINLYHTFNDSLNKLQISKRNKFARIKYESEKLEKNIVKLKKENSQIIFVAIMMLLFAIIILFILLYRNKIKKYQYIQQDQENKELIYKLFLDQEKISQEVLSRERERISQELHDGIINSLFIIRLNIGSLDGSAILNEIEKVQNQIRLISHDLKNQDFMQQGFSEIISQLIEKNNSEQLKFQLIISKNYHWGDLSYENKINIYRILQETIQNVIKHSKANNCIISIFKTDLGNKITITDDGIGFNYKQLKNSNGLRNINSRIKQLNANISIESNDKGTIIVISIPTS
jgi:signal transduction histidine kinase